MAEPAPATAPEARSFYRHQLHVSCVAFGSAEGRALFLEALRCGCADGRLSLDSSVVLTARQAL